MKMRVFMLSAALLVAGSAFAQTNDGYRAFSSLKERARIVDYNPSKRMFLIEREDSKRTWADVSAFRLTDREYLRGWLQSYKVLFGKALTVSVDQTKKPADECRSRAGRDEENKGVQQRGVPEENHR